MQFFGEKNERLNTVSPYPVAYLISSCMGTSSNLKRHTSCTTLPSLSYKWPIYCHQYHVQTYWVLLAIVCLCGSFPTQESFPSLHWHFLHALRSMSCNLYYECTFLQFRLSPLPDYYNYLIPLTYNKHISLFWSISPSSGDSSHFCIFWLLYCLLLIYLRCAPSFCEDMQSGIGIYFSNQFCYHKVYSFIS